MHRIIPQIDFRGLREFGFVTATILVLLFGYFFPVVVFDKPAPELPVAFQAGIALSTVALLLPVILKPVYIMWMTVGFVLGWINTRILLGLVFYLVFTPVACFLTLFRVDPMRRKFDEAAVSYRQPSIPSPVQQMEKPY